jgi:hypothetical protein
MKSKSRAVGLVRVGAYDPKNIVKETKVFENFLKGKSPYYMSLLASIS